MEEGYQIVYVERPDDAVWGAVGGGIRNYNTQQAGSDQSLSLCFVLQAPNQEIIGGVIGATYWDWLHIDLMWVKEEHRGRGYGQELLSLAENEARHRGAIHAYLDTFSFQAPGFYLKYGYRVFGELSNFPTGHQRIFLTKQL
jgi:ribosomal protein S18 acetylase RimI-like enzyme